MHVGHYQQTDNHNLSAKLELRRYFLRKYHRDDYPRVLDCCQGNGRIWSALRGEFDFSYWGVDLKPKAGRLKLDSVRILAQHGWIDTVIDIDTYGSPWRHWLAMLPNVTRPLTVFLTIGWLGIKQGSIGHLELDGMGLRFRRLTVPEGLYSRLAHLSVRHMLARAADYQLRLIEVVEAVTTGGARYFGVRVEPSKSAESSGRVVTIDPEPVSTPVTS